MAPGRCGVWVGPHPYLNSEAPGGSHMMTGQKDRYSTTEKLWALDDEQLTTPKHDELVLMLLNRSYSVNKFKDFFDGISDIKSEIPITTKNNFIVGYWDVIIYGFSNYVESDTGRKGTYGVTLYIECKPSVNSLGKTMRQINTYIEYNYGLQMKRDYNIAILFTPDIRYKDAFESQGIKVISP
jgi:hypothetical protein